MNARRFIIIPKDEFTEEMESLFLSNRDSMDSKYTIGMIWGDIPSIFDNYTTLNKNEYYQLLEDEPELWVPEEIR